MGGQDDYNTYRIPSLVCTKNGTVLAFTEGRRRGQDGGPTDIVLKRSLGNADKWTQEFLPLKGGGRSRHTIMMWNPLQVVFRGTNGDASDESGSSH